MPSRRLILALALLPLAACGIEPKARTAQPARAASGEAWPFAPVRLTVHPLTRLTEDRGRLRIDAHVELRDRAGDEVKGVGRMVFELYESRGPVADMGDQRQLIRWEADLTNPQRNSEAYDRVTRTYRFELSGIPEQIRAHPRLLLRATLITPSGRSLTDDHRLTPGS